MTELPRAEWKSRPTIAYLGKTLHRVVELDNRPGEKHLDDALAWLTGTFAANTIFADTVSTAKALRIKPYLSSIHTLKTGTLEAEALTGMEARTQPQLRKLARRLHVAGVERVFITRGDKGVFYSRRLGRGSYRRTPG